MSQRPKEIFDFFPPVQNIPQMHESLKMINTINAFPLNLSENVEIPQFVNTPDLEQDSFAERCEIVQQATSSSKKRKLGCTCKKTFCLKMYCECYSSSRKCGEDCACISCKNTSQFQEHGHQPKNNGKQVGKRKSSLAERRCNCKKSHCLKRYCECYNSGVGCSQACKCEGCQNRDQRQPPSNPQAPEDAEQKVESFYKKQQVSQKQQSKQSFAELNLYNSANDMDKFFI